MFRAPLELYFDFGSGLSVHRDEIKLKRKAATMKQFLVSMIKYLKLHRILWP